MLQYCMNPRLQYVLYSTAQKNSIKYIIASKHSFLYTSKVLQIVTNMNLQTTELQAFSILLITSTVKYKVL